MATVSWVHPSTRDMVIDYLAGIDAERERFLRHAGPEGIALALSSAGGSEGNRTRPLLKTASDWQQMAARTKEIFATSSERGAVLAAINAAVAKTAEEVDPLLVSLIEEALPVLVAHWNSSDEPMSPMLLERFYKCSLALEPLPASPRLGSTWDFYLAQAIGLADEVTPESAADAAAWVTLAGLLAKYEPRFLMVHNRTTRVVAVLSACLKSVREWAEALEDLLEEEDYEDEDGHVFPVEPDSEEAYDLRLIEAVEEFLEAVESAQPESLQGFQSLRDDLETHRAVREARRDRSESYIEPEDDDDGAGRINRYESEPSVQAIFRDL